MTKRKIFIIHPSDWLTDHLSIGDGLVAHGFLQELAERGHEIHVAARMAELRKPFPANVTIHRVRQSITTRPYDRIEYMLRVRSLFQRLDRKIHFDVAHQMNPVFSGLSLCLLGFRIPIVLGTYVPDWPDDEDAVTAGKGVAAAFALRAKTVVCSIQQARASAFLLTSPAARSRIYLDSRMDDHIHYLQHGVDAEQFSPPGSGMTGSPGAPSILFLSNIGVKKGIFVLLEAFNDIVAAMPNCRLTIAGGGKELPEIRDIVAAQTWANQVKILGRIPRESAAELYRTHTVYTLPSFGEPYATTMIEAMACGAPIVTTNSGGVPYMVLPDGGLTVPPRDARALAASLIELLRDPIRAAAMGQRNRRWVLDQCTWTSVVDSLERVYTHVIEDGRAARLGRLSANNIPAVGESWHV